ncbi:MAG: prolipoprotein diacylglyceryl transferase [Oscillospiraceae bacterium]|nr:prolipoprotein diacylglyceryl transferase [Oscillospiraceae bacterium]
MNSAIAFCFGSVTIYWSGLVIALGAVAGFLLSYALYTAHSGRGSDIWIFFAFSLLLGVFCSRLFHCLSNPEQYNTLPLAFLDPSQGSYWLPGAVIALLPAALLARFFGVKTTTEELLDAAAPGMALSAAFIRFSALFNQACRSYFPIKNPAFQHYPFASAASYMDASGNTVYHVATFFLSALVMLCLAVFLLFFYIHSHGEKIKPPCSRFGNTARIFLAAFCSAEFVADSARSDVSPVHFLFLRFLNRAAASVHLTQLFALVVLIALMLYYGRCSAKANDQQRMNKVLLVVFFLSLLVCIVTEILLRRSDHYLTLYLVQIVFSTLATVCIFFRYRSCRDLSTDYDEWEE